MVVDREHPPGSTEARLHLVGDEQDAVTAAHVDDPLDEPCRCGDVAALAEHRLEDRRRRLVGRGHRLEQVGEPEQRGVDLGVGIGGKGVGVRRDVDAGGQRAVAGAVRRLGGGHRHGEMGAAVEAAREHDHVRALRRLLRQLHRRLGDLGTGVRVEERVDARRRDLGESRRQRLEQIVGVAVDLRVDEPFRLALDGGDDMRVRVPGRGDGDAGREIEVLLPVGREDPRALAVRDLEVGDLEPDRSEVRRGCHARNATPGA